LNSWATYELLEAILLLVAAGMPPSQTMSSPPRQDAAAQAGT
jgi:hypothetical protein